MKKTRNYNYRKVESELYSIYSDLYTAEDAEDHVRKALQAFKIIKQDVLFKR